VIHVAGYPKIRIGSPNTREESKQTVTLEAQMTQEETKDVQKTALTSKVVNPFTRALAPPFYRETKGLLQSENTLESKEYS
jgi:hypothetical protein